jgi:hypothetical protein
VVGACIELSFRQARTIPARPMRDDIHRNMVFTRILRFRLWQEIDWQKIDWQKYDWATMVIHGIGKNAIGENRAFSETELSQIRRSKSLQERRGHLSEADQHIEISPSIFSPEHILVPVQRGAAFSRTSPSAHAS